MEDQNEERKKQYRVVRQYHDTERGLEYDLYMNLKPDLKKITTIETRTISEGASTSEFVVVIEDKSKGKCKLEMWKGEKDVVSGVVQSKRQFEKEVDYNIGHLFVSEITQNAFAIKNNSPAVAQVSDKILDFAKMEHRKVQKVL
jgi:hypothetical protein